MTDTEVKTKKKRQTAKNAEEVDAKPIGLMDVVEPTFRTLGINKSYIVQEDESIADVATKHGISVQTLVSKNNLRSFELEVGQKLII